MDTFFINTSKRFDRRARRFLFDDLRQDGKLIVLDYPMDRLSACAGHIDALITRSPELGERFRLLVYVDIAGRNEAGFAEEYASALQIEEALLGKLDLHGRQAEQAIVLFGEHFIRDKEYAEGEQFRKRVETAFWDLFPVPTVAQAATLLGELRHDKNLAADKQAFAQTFAQRMMQLGASATLSRTASGVLQELGETLCSDDTASDLPAALFRAAKNQHSHTSHPAVATPVQYAYVWVDDASYHAASRAEFQIMLFVYLCTEEARMDTLLEQSGEKQYTPATASIPDVDWAALEEHLNERDQVLRFESEHLEDGNPGFHRFRRELLEGAIHFPSSVKSPEIVTMKPVKRSVARKRLRAEAHRLFEEIRENDMGNQDLVEKFFTKLTDEYNKTKDDSLGRMNYIDASTLAENDSLTEAFIRRSMDEAAEEILSRETLLPEAQSFKPILEAAEQRIARSFDSMKLGLRLILSGFLALLAFGVPYYLIQYDGASLDYGPWYFVGTMLAVALALGLGYGLFTRFCRRKIVRELAELCERFNQAQEKRRTAMESFRTLLLRQIPANYCLQRYREEFEAHRAARRSRNAHIAYHKKVMEDYRDFLAKLREQLLLRPDEDVGEQPRTEPRLNVEKSRFFNNHVYSIVDASALRERLLRLKSEKEVE
ncbi:MAG: hypothetical protein IKS66_06470 [Oscillospiraceae bacterium]|nr:hypothetical protein [Oscillospiraceae bacterium]